MHFINVKGILSVNNGMNIYRGCTHGCIYCDSRSKCYQMNHLFEDIEVKSNAPELLEKALRSKRKKCMTATGAMTDPYIHLEEKLEYTRKCLKIIEKYGFGVCIHTKSSRILRDLDILKSINKKAKCVVQMTLTTFDEKLCGVIEPNVSTTKKRFEALEVFRDNGIPTVVWLDPILPYINDNEKNIRGILSYCIKAKVKGIICMGMGLTLREGNREYFYENLDKNFPGLKQKYIEKYGNSYEILSDNNILLMNILRRECVKNNIMYNVEQIFEYMHQFPNEKDFEQLKFY